MTTNTGEPLDDLDELEDLLDSPLDTGHGLVALRDASAADLRIAVHLSTDALTSTIGLMSHFDIASETLDDLGDRICMLLARIEMLELAQAWGAARLEHAEDRWEDFIRETRVA